MSIRRPKLIIINNKKTICRIVNFAIPADQRVKFKESKKKDEYLHLTKELKKTVEYESDCDTNFIGALVRVTKGFVQGLKDLEITG